MTSDLRTTYLGGNFQNPLILLDALQRGPKYDLFEMIHNIRAEVIQHADGAPQSDDVTMVAIKYRGGVT